MTDRVYEIEPFSFVRKAQGGKWTKLDLAYKANKEHLRVLRFHYREGWGMTFVFTMPKSWSKKKRKAMRGQPVRRPGYKDLDNILKACWDCLGYDDGTISEAGPMRKIYGLRGRIIVHQRRAEYFQTTGEIQ